MMSNGAPSTDAKSGDGGASRDGGRDRAMSRGGMSCDGATSVGSASNGGTMTGGMTSGAATTTPGAVGASSDGTLSHTPRHSEMAARTAQALRPASESDFWDGLRASMNPGARSVYTCTGPADSSEP